MEELIKAIEDYKYLVELNLNAKGYTLEHSIITQNLNDEIKKAKEVLNINDSINKTSSEKMLGTGEKIERNV